MADKQNNTEIVPFRYNAMVQAIAECHRIDELKEFGAKAAALQHYFRQANNFDAEHQAAQIRVRAFRRAGQLLKTMKESGERPAGRRKKSRDDTTLSDLGISKDDSSRAQKLAEIPEKEFEAAVGNKGYMPSIDVILRRGEKMPPPTYDLEGIDPADFKVATHVMGMVRYFAEDAEKADVSQAVRGMKAYEKAAVCENAKRCIPWLHKLTEALKCTNTKT